MESFQGLVVEGGVPRSGYSLVLSTSSYSPEAQRHVRHPTVLELPFIEDSRDRAVSAHIVEERREAPLTLEPHFRATLI